MDDRECRRTPIAATLRLELSAFPAARRLEVRLDGRALDTLVVDQARRAYDIGPLPLIGGGHQLEFHAVDPPIAPSEAVGSRDRRLLSVAFGTWSWNVPGAAPSPAATLRQAQNRSLEAS